MKGSRNNNNLLLVLIIILSIILAILVGIVIYLESTPAKMQSPTEESATTEKSSATETNPATENTLTTEDNPTTQEPTKTETTPQTTEPESTEPEESTPVHEENVETEETAKDLVVTTPYCNLYYPAQWRDKVRAEMEYTAFGCIVHYYGTVGNQEVKLFVVFFAESSDDSYPVGTITHDGTMMDVSVELINMEQGNGAEKPDAEDLNDMQEGINYLLDKLEENPVFKPISQPSRDDAPEETKDTTQDLVISTPYCDLYYPAQWKDAVRYEATVTEVGYIVVFYGTVNGKEAELFTIYFAESSEDSVPIGIYTANNVSMDIAVSMPELLENSDWSEAERESFYALQEKINYLIDKLTEDKAFEPV